MRYPNDIQAEREILAAALFKKDALLSLMEADENIFYSSDHRAIFRAITELYNINEIVDSSSVRAHLDDHKYDNIFVELSRAPVVHNYSYLVKSLEQKLYKRELMVAAQDLYKTCAAGDIEYQDFLDKIVEINEMINRPPRSHIITMTEMAAMNLDEIFCSDDFLKTGLNGLDEKLVGFAKGQLVVIAAQPGYGKTTLAWNLACNINNSLFVSYEMYRNDLYAKLLSRYSGVNSLNIESKNIRDSDAAEIFKAVEYIKANIKLTLIDSPLSFMRLVSAIRKVCKQKDINAIFIDYLQLIDGARGETKEEKIAQVTRTLKLLAVELRIPVILLSQLTKDVLKEGRMPTLGDLRGSGAIGQDADVVIFLHEKDGQTLLSIGKGRKGAHGDVAGIEFQKMFSRFVDVREKPFLGYYNDVD